MNISRVRKAGVFSVLVLSMVLLNVAPVAAATEPVTGTATVTVGTHTTTLDYSYSSPGLLGSGTIHLDFTLVNWITTGTFVLTRSDGSTLAGTENGTVAIVPSGFDVEAHFVVASGTGALAGVTGEFVLTGIAQAVVGDVFTMSGSLTTPSLTPTDKAQCKDGGWPNLANERGEPFANQGRCVSYVAVGA